MTSPTSFIWHLPQLARSLRGLHLVTYVVAAWQSLALSGMAWSNHSSTPIQPTRVIAYAPPTRTQLSQQSPRFPWEAIAMITSIAVCSAIMVVRSATSKRESRLPSVFSSGLSELSKNQQTLVRYRFHSLGLGSLVLAALRLMAPLTFGRLLRAMVYGIVTREYVSVLLARSFAMPSWIANFSGVLAAFATLAPAFIRWLSLSALSYTNFTGRASSEETSTVTASTSAMQAPERSGYWSSSETGRIDGIVSQNELEVSQAPAVYEQMTIPISESEVPHAATGAEGPEEGDNIELYTGLEPEALEIAENEDHELEDFQVQDLQSSPDMTFSDDIVVETTGLVQSSPDRDHHNPDELAALPFYDYYSEISELQPTSVVPEGETNIDSLEEPCSDTFDDGQNGEDTTLQSLHGSHEVDDLEGLPFYAHPSDDLIKLEQTEREPLTELPFTSSVLRNSDEISFSEPSASLPSSLDLNSSASDVHIVDEQDPPSDEGMFRSSPLPSESILPYDWGTLNDSQDETNVTWAAFPDGVEADSENFEAEAPASLSLPMSLSELGSPLNDESSSKFWEGADAENAALLGQCDNNENFMNLCMELDDAEVQEPATSLSLIHSSSQITGMPTINPKLVSQDNSSLSSFFWDIADAEDVALLGQCDEGDDLINLSFDFGQMGVGREPADERANTSISSIDLSPSLSMELDEIFPETEWRDEDSLLEDVNFPDNRDEEEDWQMTDEMRAFIVEKKAEFDARRAAAKGKMPAILDCSSASRSPQPVATPSSPKSPLLRKFDVVPRAALPSLIPVASPPRKLPTKTWPRSSILSLTSAPIAARGLGSWR
ncbi:hypothetical protein DXG01_006647 [Tephrocybe rancida]|nr:hypothetical protein DXG01_006647 [Tephrocybe rancida]